MGGAFVQTPCFVIQSWRLFHFLNRLTEILANVLENSAGCQHRRNSLALGTCEESQPFEMQCPLASACVGQYVRAASLLKVL